MHSVEDANECNEWVEVQLANFSKRLGRLRSNLTLDLEANIGGLNQIDSYKLEESDGHWSPDRTIWENIKRLPSL